MKNLSGQRASERFLTVSGFFSVFTQTGRGGSDDQAIVGGLAAGVLEALFERWSIGDLKAMKEIPVTGIKSFTRNVAKSFRVNASEELLTEAANIAFDTLFMGDVSNWQLSIKQYMAQGMSEVEAKRQTAMGMAGQMVEAGMSGGLMGLGFGSIGSMENAIGDRVKRFQQMWEEANRTVETPTSERRDRKEVEIRLADPEGRGYNDRGVPLPEDEGWNEREEAETGNTTDAQVPDGGDSKPSLVQYGADFGKMGIYVEHPNIRVDWTQYAGHGRERMQQRGITQKMIDDIVENGKVLSQNNGRKFAYIAKEGVVIVSKEGKMITAWGSKDFDASVLEILKILFEG